MYHYEIIWLENCPLHFKLTVYRQFVDDTFLLFRSMDQVEKFKNYLNKQHKNKIYVWNWGKWLCHLLSGGHRLKFGWRLSTMRGGGKLNTYIWIILDPFGREGRGGGFKIHYFADVINGWPLIKTFIGKLKLWSQCRNTIIISKTSWTIVLISSDVTFVLSYLGKISLDLRTRIRQNYWKRFTSVDLYHVSI